MATKGSTDLLNYLTANPPDLNLRQYKKSLGLKTSDAEVGDASVGRMLVVPGPPRSTIFARKAVDTPELKYEVQDESASLVSPILWLPGVLRSCGSWSVAMKETTFGEAYITKAEDPIRLPQADADSTIVRSHDYEKEIAEKNQLITSLEQSVARQKNLNLRLMRRFKEHTANCMKNLEKARQEEGERHAREMENRVNSSVAKINNLQEELITTKKAMRVRVRRAYAQDNFLTMYSKAMITVRDQAKEIAKKRLNQLENQVGALERRIITDTEYKKILQRRTEAAEVAAEKRWEQAEQKIPILEDRIAEERAKAEKARMSEWGEKSKTKRTIEQLSAQVMREKEMNLQLSKAQEEMKRELQAVKTKWRNQKLRADDLKKELDVRTSNYQDRDRQSGVQSSFL